jgi:hypothetical protein
MRFSICITSVEDLLARLRQGYIHSACEDARLVTHSPRIGDFESDPVVLDWRRLEIQMGWFFRAVLRVRRKARANGRHASEDSKSFARRRARLIQPSVLSTTQLLGRTMKPSTVVSARLTTVMDIRLASSAALCASSP